MQDPRDHIDGQGDGRLPAWNFGTASEAERRRAGDLNGIACFHAFEMRVNLLWMGEGDDRLTLTKADSGFA